MGAIINGLAGTDADTGIEPEAILPLIAFWEQTRGLYQPFEADMRAGSTDVYLHEMPGGELALHRCCCRVHFRCIISGVSSEHAVEHQHDRLALLVQVSTRI